MHGIQPSALSDKEFVHYVTLVRPEDLPPAWVAELIKRLAKHLDTAVIL